MPQLQTPDEQLSPDENTYSQPCAFKTMCRYYTKLPRAPGRSTYTCARADTIHLPLALANLLIIEDDILPRYAFYSTSAAMLARMMLAY